jgi:hypothetical protein
MAVQSPSSIPPRARNPYMRIAFSAVLVAFAIFVVQYRKTLPSSAVKTSTAAASKPFPSSTPSGDGQSRFAWLPSFPGAEVGNIRTKITHGEESYGYTFHAPGEFKDVSDFYSGKLKATGFTVVDKQHADGVDLHAENPDRTRLLDISTVKSPSGSGTEVGVNATQR